MLFSTILQGKSHENNNSFLIHLDKPFYITGEVIWYKLYYPSTLAERTVSIKGILVGPNGKVLERFFHKTEQSSYLHGHLEIPYNYASGQYQLVFNSNITEQDQEITLAEIAVPIYNDLEPLTNGSSTETTKSNLPNILDLSELQIKLDLNQTSFQPRALINANILVTDKNGSPTAANLSVSVIDKKIASINKANYFFTTEGAELPATDLSGLAENVYLKGTIFGDQQTPIQANVIGAYASKQNKIHYAKSNATGAFTLELPDFYKQQTIQFLPYEKEASDITVKILADAIPAKGSQALSYDDQILQQLKSSQQRKKMLQYYEHLAAKIELEEYVNEIQELKPNARFNIGEYEKFDRIYDFFSELITPLQFKKVKGIYIASMTNPRARYAVLSKLSGNPLFIIDGKATRDANFIAQVSMSNIESIELFYVPQELRKQFNILGLGGVVKINTIIPQFDLPEADKEDLFDVDGLQQIGKFSPFDPTKTKKNIPNFSSTLHWDHNIVISKQGKGSFSFYQSDDLGTFSIIVIAQDKEGNRGIKILDYEVGK